MISAVDGRAAVQGRSVALGHPADRALLRELRAGADAILVGSRTLAAERYATLLDDDQRARRAAAGRPTHPVVATVSRRLDAARRLPAAARGRRADRASSPRSPAHGARRRRRRCEVVVAAARSDARGAVLDALAAAGLRGVLCEGGPVAAARLVAAARRLDDLLLTVAPLLVGRRRAVDPRGRGARPARRG